MSLNSPDTNNALLIFHAGASCKTHYRTTDNDKGSSSTPGRARDGFVDFWGVSSNADVKWRISHLSNWNDMIKNELFQGRPVLYSGGSISDKGHSWVIDGYANGLFHCNWGWDGYYDGPYSIAGFDTQNGSFNQLESAIFNVYPVQSEGVAKPELTAQSFTYSPNGHTITFPEAFGATSYQWSCSHGTIQGSGTSATLFSECNSTVSVRAFNSRCQIYSNTNSKLMTIKYGPITGPSSICSLGSIFTLNNRPSNLSVNWIHSSNLTYVGGQGTNNYTVQAANSAVSGMGWVKAIVSSSCGNDTIEKNVWVGKPAKPTIICPYPIVGLNSLIEANAVGPGAESYQWNVGGGTITSGQGTSDIWITTSSHCQYDLTIRLTTSNSCGSSAQAIKSIPFDCSGGITPLSVSPNPADNILTVEINNNKTPDNLNNIDLKTSELRIYDKMMTLKKQKQFKGDLVKINVTDLQEGVYIIQLISGKKIYKEKIIISH